MPKTLPAKTTPECFLHDKDPNMIQGIAFALRKKKTLPNYVGMEWEYFWRMENTLEWFFLRV